MSSISSEGSKSGEGPAARKKRIRHWTSSDRARHRVIEKERREAFNERLLELARLLPALNGCKPSQLSKHVIVHESIKLHNAKENATEVAEQKLAAMTAERNALLIEVNQWRVLSGMEPCPAHTNVLADDTRRTAAPMPVGTSSIAAQHPSSFQYAVYQTADEVQSATSPFYSGREFSIQPQPQFNHAAPEVGPPLRPMGINQPTEDVLRPGQSSNDYYLQQSMVHCLSYETPT